MERRAASAGRPKRDGARRAAPGREFHEPVVWSSDGTARRTVCALRLRARRAVDAAGRDGARGARAPRRGGDVYESVEQRATLCAHRTLDVTEPDVTVPT